MLFHKGLRRLSTYTGPISTARELKVMYDTDKVTPFQHIVHNMIYDTGTTIGLAYLSKPEIVIEIGYCFLDIDCCQRR